MCHPYSFKTALTISNNYNVLALDGCSLQVIGDTYCL